MRQYAELFRVPGAKPAEFFALIGRFGYVACGLSVLFLGTARLGIGVGGLGASGLTIGVALGSPVAGRLSSRFGTSPVYAAAATTGTAGAALALSGAEARSVPGFLAGACVLGFTTPPIGAAMRALWPRTELPERLHTPANSFESVVTELLFIAAPPATGALAVIDPRLGLIVADGCVVVGGVGFASTRLVRRHLGPSGAAVRKRAARTLSPPVVWLLCVAATTAAVAGAMDVAVVSVLDESGAAESAGYVLLAPALGSVLGGAVYGLLPAERVPGRRFGLLLAAWLVLFSLVSAQSGPWALAGALFLAGIPMAAIGIEEFTLLGRVCETQDRLQEVFTWAGSSANVGVAAGSALCGYVAEHRGGTFGGWMPTAAVAVACVLYLTGFPRFRPAPAPGIRGRAEAHR
ncbi:hypothetical protein [Streptomyces sp. NPDC048636]|uniref:hypothetical protein n=1 Tax=Streptomyces sp. NPDC048636 TaxID=3155762 RepID=UPI0034227410